MKGEMMLLGLFCSLVILNEALCDKQGNPKVCNMTQESCVTSSCQSMCNCSDIYYFNDARKKCLSINQTSKDDVIIIRTTDSLTFRWPSDSYIYGKRVQIGTNNYSSNPLDNSSITIKDLEPGTDYLLTVVSYFALPENTTTTDITNHHVVWTMPAKPGQVTSVQEAIDKQENMYSIKFTAPRGKVRKYMFSVTQSGYPKCINEIFNTSTFCNLKPGQLYNYTIKACNLDSDCGEEITDHFTTPEKRSDRVTDFEAEMQGSNEATLMWKPPKNSNGKITHYLLTVVDLLGEDSNPCVFYVDNTHCKANETSGDGRSNQCFDQLNCTTVANEKSRDNFSVIVNGLKICTNYSVNVTAVNKAGAGFETTIELENKPDVAAAVPTVRLDSSRNEITRQMTLSAWWDPSPYQYESTYFVIVREALRRSSEDFIDVNSIEGYTETFLEQMNVRAYWRYEVCVQTQICNMYRSDQTCLKIITEENNPGTVQSLSVSQHEKIAQNFTLHFKCPPETEQNGNITGYFIRKILDHENQSQSEIVEHNSTSCINEYIAGGLVVGKNYSFSVMARNNRYNGSYSDPVSLKVFPKKPIVMEKNGVKAISSKDTGKDTDSEVVISVCVECLLDSSQGEVVNAGLVVCFLSDGSYCNKTGEIEFSTIGTWRQSKNSLFRLPYRATDSYWHTSLNSTDAGHPAGGRDFKLGADTNCELYSEAVYCNGPLPLGRKFQVSAIVCTDGGCTQVDSDTTFETKPTSGDSHTGTHVALALGTLLGAGLLGVLIFLALRRNAPQFLERICDWNGKRVSYVPDKRFNRPVKIKDFEKHVQKLHKDSNLLFQDEFESIKKISSTFKKSSDEAKRESNRVKNRYVDILPYDHSRVKLDVQPEEDETNDFINANYIPGYNSVREYIATQGPMHCTVVDFWRMVWEQKSQVIVMLSDLQENGKLKVDQYWPDTIDEPVNFDNVVVELTNFSQLNKFIIRNFKVSKGDDMRKLTQFVLPGWWDFSANLNFLEVIEFVKLIRQENTPEPSGPIIVHCSAGVGRTGTLIALDYFIQYVEEHSIHEYVDIFSYVLLMRKNRPRMVQAESQYIFIYDTVLEIIKQKIARETDDNLKEVLTNGRLSPESPQKPCICLDVQETEEGTCVYTNKALDSPTTEHENLAPKLENPPLKLDSPEPDLDNPALDLDNPTSDLDKPAPDLDKPAQHKVRFMNEYSSLEPHPNPELISFCQK